MYAVVSPEKIQLPPGTVMRRQRALKLTVLGNAGLDNTTAF